MKNHTIKIGFMALLGSALLIGCEGSPPPAGLYAGFKATQRYTVSSGGNGPAQGGVTSADFNRDGFDDVAATDTVGGAVSVMLSRGDGTLESSVGYATGLLPYAVVAADLDGDRISDLAVANSGSDTVSVLRGIGDGTFAAATDYATGSLPSDLAAVDLNGDGHLDLASYYGDVSILLNDGHGKFAAKPDLLTATPAGAVSIAMSVADFSGDGIADIVVTDWVRSATQSRIALFIGKGDGSFAASPVSHTVSGATEAMRPADVDCDGKLDLVVPVAGGNILVLPGQRSNELGAPIEHDMESGTNAVTFADFDGDRKLDLAVSFFNGSVGIISDVCKGGYAITSSYPTVETSEAFATPDLNRDGMADLVVGTWFSPMIAVLVNTPRQ